MTISNLKELEAVVKMCKKHGVRTIEVDGIKMQINEAEEKLTSESGKDAELPPVYTDEQILNWSSAAVGAE